MAGSDQSEFIEAINDRFKRVRKAVMQDREKIAATDDLLRSARWHLWTAAFNAAMYSIYEYAVTAAEERGPHAGIKALTLGIAERFGARPVDADPFSQAAVEAQREAARQVLADMRGYVDNAEFVSHLHLA